MPVHDWTRVDAGLFHNFHQGWTVALYNALNTGVLPADYLALVEQRIRSPNSDTLRREEVYGRLANRIAVRNQHGDVVAVVEIVSPGNKANQADLRAFVTKAADLIRQGIQMLVIDVLPPGPRDPQGIHKAIWDEFAVEDFELPSDKPLILASYEAGSETLAYVEPVGVGDVLPDMPIFLQPGFYVPAPLEATYQATWAVFPAPLKRLLESC